MASSTCTSFYSCSLVRNSQCLPSLSPPTAAAAVTKRPSHFPKLKRSHLNSCKFNHIFSPLPSATAGRSLAFARAAAAKSSGGGGDISGKKEEKQQEEEVEEVEEELPWIQEKALDLVEFTGSVTQAIPGPRVGGSSFPWILAVPFAYFGITFVIAFVKTVRKFNSPRAKRRKLVLISLSSLPPFTPVFYRYYLNSQL